MSALSLATAVHKPITKEEKEAANNKKSSPVKLASAAKNASQINFIDNKLINDAAIPTRPVYMRHHLGRTTGLGKSQIVLEFSTQNISPVFLWQMIHFTDMEDGALLPSPTRDKLMPTIPKSKEDDSYSSQRGSPKKSSVSRHGSPQKGSPQKQSMQKKMMKQGKRQHVSIGRGAFVYTNTNRWLPYFGIKLFVFRMLSILKQIDRNPLVPNETPTSKVRPNDSFVRAVLHPLRAPKFQKKLQYQHQQSLSGAHDQVSNVDRQ